MDQTFNLNQNVESLFANLEDFTQREGLLGKPLNYDNKTFIPVISVTLGYGGGNTASKAQQGTAGNGQGTGVGSNTTGGAMAGGAMGLGAKLCSDAVIVIDNNNVSMLPLATGMNANQLIEKIPQMFMGKQNGQQSQGTQNQGTQRQQTDQQGM